MSIKIFSTHYFMFSLKDNFTLAVLALEKIRKYGLKPGEEYYS